jgi:nitrile hydratase
MHEHGHDHLHEHDHDHDGFHRPRPAGEAELRTRALEALLVEKGLVSTDAIDAVIDLYVNDVGPQNGARVVARAWVDPTFRERLLADGSTAIHEMGYGGEEGHTMMVVANTPEVHNVIVCTLCSCYPIALLGPSPTWYKSESYRARVVRQPRDVLRELGLAVDPDVEITVWDASAESRYMVLPRRPDGTEDRDEAALAALVTRNGLIGVAAV